MANDERDESRDQHEDESLHQHLPANQVFGFDLATDPCEEYVCLVVMDRGTRRILDRQVCQPPLTQESIRQMLYRYRKLYGVRLFRTHNVQNRNNRSLPVAPRPTHTDRRNAMRRLIERLRVSPQSD